MSEWIKCSERLPTEADADYTGRVVFWSPRAGSGIAGPNAKDFKSGHWTHWMPTGLKRPEPPEEGDSK